MRLASIVVACCVAAGALAAAAPATLPAANEDLLHSARAWELHGRGDLARLALEKLIAARPDRPEFLLLLGELCLRMGDVAGARDALERLRARHPQAPATRDFALAYRVGTSDRLRLAAVRRLLETGRGAAAAAALSGLFPDGAPDGELGIEYYRLLARTPGNWEAARAGLAQLAAAHRDDPRFSLALVRLMAGRPASARGALVTLQQLATRDDLAGTEVAAALDVAVRSIGFATTPLATLRAYVARNPADSGAARALAGRERAAEAGRRRVIESPRTVQPDEQAALAAALEHTLRARLAAVAGDHAAFESWAAQGLLAQPADGKVLAALRAQPDSIRSRVLAAGYWHATGRAAAKDGAAAIAAVRLRAAAGFLAGEPDPIVDAAADLEGLDVAEEAGAMLGVARALLPASTRLFAARVRWLAAHGAVPAALAELDANAPPAMDAAALRLLRANVLDERAQAALAAGDARAARADFEQALAAAPDDAWIRFRLAKRYAADGEAGRGRRLLAEARSARPADVDLGYAEALYLASVDAPGEALAVLATIPAESRSQGIDELQARLEDALAHGPAGAPAIAAPALVASAPPAPAAPPGPRAGLIAGALQFERKPGDSGVSDFTALQVPFEWRLATAGPGQPFVRADTVRLDAGRLPRTFAGAALVGTVAAAGPASIPSLLAVDGPQTGLALGLGYASELLTADIGTTPLGFALTNVVGGLKWTPKLGPFDIGLGVARRAVTSSVLSYAGERDPVTGRRWGGVVETGPALQAGRYEGRYSVAGSVRATWLDGTRVLGNHFFGARLAADSRFLDRPGLRAYVGATVNYWAYDQSLLNYTFGSGGYYSPQSYVSVGIPLEAIGEGNGMSFRVRAAIARSVSRTREMPLYPNDPALQAAAAQGSLPQGFDRPYFAGGRSSGTSFSFYCAAERQLGADLVLGAALDLDRSDFYHPTTLLVYVRHALGKGTVPLALPPRPVRPYADF